MIAVAVAMSVIIFMWSQGFLSNTSSATGSQQGSQNVAAQSSIAIESVIGGKGFVGTIITIIRNVGSVSVTLGNCIISGTSANTGFIESTIFSTSQFSSSTIAKGLASQATAYLPNVQSGDVLSVKCTTTAGTFASTQYLVP